MSAAAVHPEAHDAPTVASTPPLPSGWSHDDKESKPIPSDQSGLGLYGAIKLWFADDGFTGHGIPRVFDRDKKIAFVWFIIVSLNLYFICDGTVRIFSDYLKLPAVTTNSWTPKASLPFPAVTVCSTFHFEPDYDPTTDLLDGSYLDKACNATDFIVDFGFGQTADLRLHSQKSHGDTMWSSKFSDKVVESWKQFILPSRRGAGGPCATFNADGKFTSSVTTDGLEIGLAIVPECNRTFTGAIPEEQGFSLLLHEPGVQPNPVALEDHGMLIQPGARTVIKFDVMSQLQTHHPITAEKLTCTQGKSYKEDSCTFDVHWKSQLASCGCAHPPPTSNPAVSCSSLVNKTVVTECLDKIAQEASAEVTKKCGQACQRKRFPSTSSSYHYPSVVAANAIWDFLRPHRVFKFFEAQVDVSDPSLQMGTKLQMLRETIALVHVAPRSIGEETVSVDLKYPDFSALLSSIGGTWSFFLGFSIVTFIEVILAPFVVAWECKKRQ